MEWWQHSELWVNGGASTIKRPVEVEAIQHLRQATLIQHLRIQLDDLELEVLTLEKMLIATKPRLTSQTARLQYIVHYLAQRGTHLTGVQHARAILERCEKALRLAEERMNE